MASASAQVARSLVADGHAVVVDGPAADDQLLPVEGEAHGGADRIEHASTGGDDLGADAVARDGDDAVGGHARTSRTTASRSLLRAET